MRKVGKHPGEREIQDDMSDIKQNEEGFCCGRTAFNMWSQSSSGKNKVFPRRRDGVSELEKFNKA